MIMENYYYLSASIKSDLRGAHASVCEQPPNATSQTALLTKQTQFICLFVFCLFTPFPREYTVSRGVPEFKRLGSMPLERTRSQYRMDVDGQNVTLTDSFNSGTGEFTRKVERQRVAVQGDSPRKFICAEDVYGRDVNGAARHRVVLRYIAKRRVVTAKTNTVHNASVCKQPPNTNLRLGSLPLETSDK